jgi:RNA polymerase sigma-70 factor (ECF subfamily)
MGGLIGGCGGEIVTAAPWTGKGQFESSRCKVNKINTDFSREKPVSDTPTDQELVEQCRTGNEAAATELFNRYVSRLLGIARKRIGERMNSRLDPEDVVQSVFRTFFARLKNDQFRIDDQDDLSKLLVRITLHKTLKQIAHHRAARRDPNQEVPQTDASRSDILQLLADEPTPETVVAFVDQLDHFLGRLSADEQQILILRLQGHSTEEIAQQIKTYDRKVRRVLERVRALAQEADRNLGL